MKKNQNYQNNRNKIYLVLIRNFSKNNNLDDAIEQTLNQMKIKKNINEFKNEYLPQGILSLMFEINEILNDKIKKLKKPRNFSNYRTHEKIIFFVVKRLEQFNNLVDKKKIFKETIKPSLFISSNKILFKISDEIWYLSGDKSTDINYYTKRLILMKIYALTFSFFVFDQSDDFTNTKMFLDKQIQSVISFGKFKNKVKNRFNQ